MEVNCHFQRYVDGWGQNEICRDQWNGRNICARAGLRYYTDRPSPPARLSSRDRMLHGFRQRQSWKLRRLHERLVLMLETLRTAIVPAGVCTDINLMQDC